MASTHTMTAYIYCVPMGTSESALTSMLNDGKQSGCSICVNEIKQGVASIQIYGSGLYF